MPIIKKDEWEECVEMNQDPYGKCCVDIARRIMEILDAEEGDFDPHALISRGEKETGDAGITGFMAGCIAGMASEFHSRGDEFRRKWNIKTQIGTEGEKANESGGILNPALMCLSTTDGQ